MSEYDSSSPTIEVTVYRQGRVIARELCETLDEADDVLREWSEVEGVECEVDDLSVQHGGDTILAADADETFTDEEYRPEAPVEPPP